MNGECCGSREEGQANDLSATLVVVYYTTIFKNTGGKFIICFKFNSLPADNLCKQFRARSDLTKCQA